MKYTKSRRVKIHGLDLWMTVLWSLCAVIWTANTYIEAAKHNWAGAGLRAFLVVVYLFLAFAKYYEVKSRQR